MGGALAGQAQQVAAGGDAPLQLREVRPAALQHDQLAVEHRPGRYGRANGPADIRKVGGQVAAGPGLEIHPVGVSEGDGTPPVPLRLVNQFRALGHLVDGRGEHRRDRPAQHRSGGRLRPAGRAHRLRGM